MNLLQVDEEQNLSLPEEWQWVRLGDLTNTTSGTTPSRNRNDYYRGNIPWIKTGELRDSTIETAEEYITEVALKETSLKLLPAQTLLVAMYGQGQTRGRTGILAIPATINQACFAILPNPERFAPRFLQFWFRYNYVNLRHETEKRGGNQPNLNGKILSDLHIPLPPLAEQKRIVAILDEKLAAVERARAAAQAQLQAAQVLPAAYLRAVFESEAAQEWPLYELGEASEIVGGIQKTPERTPRNFHRPFLTVRNVQRGFLDLSTVGRFEITEDELERYRLYAGDILMVEGNGSLSHIGRNALFDGELDDCIHQNHIIRVRCQPDYLYPPYASHYFNSASGQAQMIKNAETSSGLYTLSAGKIASLEIPIPDVNQQKLLVQELSTKMDSVNPVLKAISEQLVAIEALPAALLRQAFTGEL